MPKLICFILILFSQLNLFSQDRYDNIQRKLDSLSTEIPGLKHKIEFSVSGTSIQELIRTIASENELNIVVDQKIDVKASTNFSNITISELLVFLCRRYALDINFTGTIISIIPYSADYIPKEVKIEYIAETGSLNIDLSYDTLNQVAKIITNLTGKNIIYSSTLSNKVMNGYVKNLPVINAIEKIASINDLKFSITDDSVFVLEAFDNSPNPASRNAGRTMRTGSMGGLKINGDGLITLDVSNIPIIDVIAGVASKLNISYFFLSDPKGNSTISVQDATFNDFLSYLLNGTEYSFKIDNNIYFIGDKANLGIRNTKVIALRYRTVDKVIDYIPENLKSKVEIKIFPDQNSLIITGSDPDIWQIEDFLKFIDKVVPVIAIELLIVEVRNSKTLSTGIEAGIGDKPATTGGTVFPNYNMTLSATSINNLISGLSGFSSINLGNVTPNFYLKLRALEQQGVLKLRSTPKLATLNGHEATLSIGKTEYYLEVSNNVIGTQNPQNIITQTYKSVNADLALKINPIVSGDEQITLDIDIKQSSFTERISPSAPPGTITRNFKSLIRVKNEDMIILGGLEENSSNDTGSGVPLLSRIPVIKWFFSSRDFNKSKNKLTIFIKSTVMY